jgi:hypothetical protein
MVLFLLAVLTGAGIFPAGCGYSFLGEAQRHPSGIRRVTLPPIQNQTTYTTLTYSLTNNLIHHFNRSKTFRMVDPPDAQAVLDVQIVSLALEGASRISVGESASRRVVVTASAVLKRLDTGETVSEVRNATALWWYSSTGSQDNIEANLNDALEEVTLRLAETIHDRLVEAF